MADVTRPAPVDRGDHWELPIAGATVDQCCFDYGVVLRLSNVAGAWELRIEQSFVYTAADGTESLVEPEEGTRVELVLSTLRSTVAGARAYKDGALALNFEGEVRVDVPPDEGYEAWELGGPGGVRLVSLPGGDLAVWGSG